MNDKINELGLEICDLIEKYKSFIPSYEMGNQMISNAVSMMLFTAPNTLVAMKTILACVENGIASYQEHHE